MRLAIFVGFMVFKGMGYGKKIAVLFALAAALAGWVTGAQMMGAQNFGVSQEVYEHTIREEAEGGELWRKLQAREISCEDLDDENFGAFGEYFMGQMMGDTHAAMNAMMIQVHGEDGEEEIHIVMGKRLSGCDTSAAFPAGGFGWIPMMQMMFPLRHGFAGQGGGWSSPSGLNAADTMMNFGYGPFGFWGWGGFGMILWWVLIAVLIFLLVRWLMREVGHGGQRRPLEILKERYARGEITREEFEEKKRDLS